MFLINIIFACQGNKTSDSTAANDDSGTTIIDTGTETTDTGNGTTDTSIESTDTATNEVSKEELCEQWCEATENSCSEWAIHPHESCLAFCNNPLQTIEIGEEDDSSGNTWYCRINQATQASSTTGQQKEDFCTAASFNGGGVCGDTCDNYCAQYETTCTNAPYPSVEECINICETDFSGTPLMNPPVPLTNFGYGDTPSCRYYHLKVSMIDDSFNTHCPHASQDSTTGTCSDQATPNIPNYCAFVTTFCTDENALFTPNELTTCQSTMAGLVPSVYAELAYPSFQESSGANLGCLNYWAYQTALNPNHCAKADWKEQNWYTNGGQGACYE